MPPSGVADLRDGMAARGGLAAPWQVDVGPSRRLGAVLVAGHAVAAVAVAAAGLPLAAAGASWLLLCVSAGFHLHRVACVASPRSIVRLRVDGEGTLRIHFRDGRTASGLLDGSTVVGWRLTLVRLRLDGDVFVRTVPLVRDNCSASAFRRLRAGLAWQAGAALRR